MHSIILSWDIVRMEKASVLQFWASWESNQYERNLSFSASSSVPLCVHAYFIQSPQNKAGLRRRSQMMLDEAQAKRLDRLKPGSAPRWNRSCREMKRRFYRTSEEKEKTCTSSRRQQEEYLVFLPFFLNCLFKKKRNLKSTVCCFIWHVLNLD